MLLDVLSTRGRPGHCETSQRSVGSSTTNLLIFPQTVPYLIASVGLAGVFYLTAVVCLVGAAFSFLCIPITRNLSLLQLETMFDTVKVKSPHR